MTTRPSLETEFCGLELRNPFLLAPTPSTATGEQVERAFSLGWGGAVWKTLGEVPNTAKPKVSPRYASIRDNQRQISGFENIDLGNAQPLDDSFREMEQAKRRFTDHLVVSSIRGGNNPDIWKYLARRSEAAGADMIEAMFSCPHDIEDDDQSGDDPLADLTAMITQWVNQATSLPVMIKMSPNYGDMRPMARRAKRCGAAAISAANTIRCLSGVDLVSLRPLPSVNGFSTFGGYSGPAIKPIILRHVAELATDSQIGLPISGVGGIATWRDAVEYLLLGASNVQIGTAVMLEGYRIIDDLLDGLRRFMSDHGFLNIQSMVGKSLHYLVPHRQLDREYREIPTIDLPKCVRCGNCYVACLDGGYQAIKFGADRVPSVISSRCVGCGLCENVCPSGCINLCPVEMDSLA